MKATFKDNLREIKNSPGRFLSIFAIVAIGCAFYAGIRASAPDMLYTADKYYKDQNLMDIRITSQTINGICEEDVDKIRKTEGIEGIYPTHIKDVITISNNSKMVLRAHGIPINNLNPENNNYINRITITEGRLPEQSGECLVENKNFLQSGLKIGEKIILESGLEEPLSQSMKTCEYTIVGTAKIPLYVSFERGVASIGDGTINSFILLPEDDFIHNTYTDVFMTVKGTKDIDSYGDEYFNVINEVKDKVTSPEWIVTDRNSHFGFRELKNASENMETIAAVFPVFFFFVAVLVCMTTMTRMVDEQRGAIGTYKALGYSVNKIILKYLLYAGPAAVLGGVAGCTAGVLIFPTIIFNAWKLVYTLPSIAFVFQPVLVITTILVAVIIIITATFFACKKELTRSPAILMRPKAPKAGKKIFVEKINFIWKKLSFIQKVTVRNIFRYKKRFIMTVIGISGCTALLVGGFGIYDSVSEIVNLHFHEIHLYDGVVYSTDMSPGAREDYEGIFEKYKGIKQSAGSCQYFVTLDNGDEDINTTVLIPENVDEFRNFMVLRNLTSKKEIDLNTKGILIDEKLSKELNVKIGDTISVPDKIGKEEYIFQIDGIIENYMGHYIIMSPDTYRIAYGHTAPQTTLLVKFDGMGQEEESLLGEELMSDKRILSVAFTTGMEENINDTIKSLNIITAVLIVSAGALAFVVLYNLTNISVSERLREIATIKVLGFFDKEVSAYVYRENIILTILGSIMGLGLGVLLHRVVMSVVDMKNIMFGKNINIISFILSFILTIIFSVIVNLVMYWKLKKIHMVESLKSIE